LAPFGDDSIGSPPDFSKRWLRNIWKFAHVRDMEFAPGRKNRRKQNGLTISRSRPEVYIGNLL
jgi:hypothetical protein